MTTLTSRLGLSKPAAGEKGWGAAVNANFDRIDRLGSYVNVVTKTGDYTMTELDDVVLADTTGGSFTVTLPSAVGITGRRFTLKKAEILTTNAVTFATSGGQTIDGSPSRVLFNDLPATVISDGANWLVIG
jgi:hypothetical protein